MRWIAATGLFLVLVTSAAAGEKPEVEQIKLRPENFIGKSITLTGVISMAERNTAVVSFKAGRLRDGSFPLQWPDRGAAWEYAQYECAGFGERAKCKATVTGELQMMEGFTDRYVIKAQSVDFPPK